MKKEQKVSRRGFLQGTAAAAGAMAFPTIVPGSVFGQNAPSNRVVMGAIGTGSMGTGDLRGFLNKPEVQMVAVCDVDKNHRDEAKRIVDQRYRTNDCRAYNDFRELLARGDLDAVQIAIPDHWHGIISVAAARTGVDIHGQKPLARSIREGRAICDAVERYGIVWQTGSQQRSDSRFRQACELVRNGRLGKIEKVEVGLPTGGTYPLQPEKPVPAGLDWDMWLGPAPWRPFCDFGNDGCHYQWRWIMDYSGGQMTDWAGHHIDIANWGLDLDHTGPVEIEGKGVYPEDGLYNVPMRYHVECKYANGIPVINGGFEPSWDAGIRFHGAKGWVEANHHGVMDASPKSLLREPTRPSEVHLYNSPDPHPGKNRFGAQYEGYTVRHYTDWIRSMRTRQRPVADVEIGCRSLTVCLLGNIAYWLKRPLKWDPVKEEFLGDPEANRLLDRPMRPPWTL